MRLQGAALTDTLGEQPTLGVGRMKAAAGRVSARLLRRKGTLTNLTEDQHMGSEEGKS